MPVNKRVIDSSISRLAEGRLTLTSNTPVLTNNVVTATTLYYTPYVGNRISLYETDRWNTYTFSELSLSLTGLTTDTNYDVFIYNNLGTLTLEAVAWSNSGSGTSLRASALTWKDGVRVKQSDNRKYLGSFRTIATGQTEFSFVQQNVLTPVRPLVINEFNKVKYEIKFVDNTNSAYITNTWRNWRASTNARIDLLIIQDTLSLRLDLRRNQVSCSISVSWNNATSNQGGSSEGAYFYAGGALANQYASGIFKHYRTNGFNQFYLIEYGYTGAVSYEVAMSIEEWF